MFLRDSGNQSAMDGDKGPKRFEKGPHNDSLSCLWVVCLSCSADFHRFLCHSLVDVLVALITRCCRRECKASFLFAFLLSSLAAVKDSLPYHDWIESKNGLPSLSLGPISRNKGFSVSNVFS